MAKIQDSPGECSLMCFLWEMLVEKGKRVGGCIYDGLMMLLDCPEREATYIITNGGISDPEKV